MGVVRGVMMLIKMSFNNNRTLYLQPEEHITSVGCCGGLEVSGHRAGY